MNDGLMNLHNHLTHLPVCFLTFYFVSLFLWVYRASFLPLSANLFIVYLSFALPFSQAIVPSLILQSLSVRPTCQSFAKRVRTRCDVVNGNISECYWYQIQTTGTSVGYLGYEAQPPAFARLKLLASGVIGSVHSPPMGPTIGVMEGSRSTTNLSHEDGSPRCLVHGQHHRT
jgi:hypothetical protein